jgi:uncharacterized repeat protein (TIGR03803 family)
MWREEKMKMKSFRTSGALVLTTLMLVVAAATTAATAQTFTQLFSFDGADGQNTSAGLVQARDGNFYGTMSFGGAGVDCTGVDGCGTVFKISPEGRLTTLYRFCAQTNCADGSWPYAGLVQATDGNFYGTTQGGGASSVDCTTNGCGTVFRITPSGALTMLYSFCAQTNCADGSWPYAWLVQATDGSFYGTTSGGGSNGNGGTIFKITPSGKLTTLYSFCALSGCADGDGLFAAGLVRATDGNFYGVTMTGGANGAGTVFRITPSGALTTLYSFCSQRGCRDGGYPSALLQVTDGNFYGVTSSGGAHGWGTLFKTTPGGTLTTLYTFCSQTDCTDGGGASGLVQGTDGMVYGPTAIGGANGAGTVFRITPSGALTTLYSFCSQTGCADAPESGLLQATNGNFYGTTWGGGADNAGTVFSLSVGLGPFVKLQPDWGKVGQTRGILGQGFTGTTSVSFNGIPAIFTVVRDTFLTATVPSGATTGFVTVTTPSGTLTSNQKFRVSP